MTTDASSLTSRARSGPGEGKPATSVQFRAWVEAFARLGYAVDGLLRDVGIDRSTLDDPDALISCALTGALFERTQRIQPLKNLWSRLAAVTPIGALPLLDYLILTADTVGGAWTQFARYSRLLGAPLSVEIRADEDPVRVMYFVDASASASSVEYSIGLARGFLLNEAAMPTSFAFASFIHEPDDVAEIERILGCPVRSRASWAGVAMTLDAWQVPLKRRDPILRAILEHQADAIASSASPIDCLALDVRKVLATRLARGEAEIDLVARDLAMSSRTLQRRLSSAGLSYQELFDAVRREIAEKCISEARLSIGEIAHLLGYSEPAAFHRAFKRWTGVTPQVFRQRRRAHT